MLYVNLERSSSSKAIAIQMPSLILVGLTRDFPLYAPRVEPHVPQNSVEFRLIIRRLPSLANMSDYEDDMDLDDAPTKESVMFSSDNTNVKGKRSAANLPVEAEDSLPW